MSRENKSLQSEGEVRRMAGTVTPLHAEVQLFNNVFLNAKFSTVYCGLPISPDTRLISARPKELIYTIQLSRKRI